MFYNITGFYKNGDSYDSGNLNIHELSAHLDELTDNRNGQLYTAIKKSDHPDIETLHIETYKD
tara:strand:- start:314 stop:502 length:189 start_codon:yes stop_codon:yes gene_type:complete